MGRDPAEFSLTEAAEAIRARQLSSVEATRHCLEQIERWQPRLNCVISLDAEEALARAAALDEDLARGNCHGPLHGVPLAHKDIFYRAGKVSTGGSEIRRHWRAETTATAIERLDQAGAIDLGRLNMSEFAAGPTGHNKWYGDCRNPWNHGHITGGSSSGSGAAVAARLVYGALGSDTGGSIRLPAAANGVLGLKPTYGRVSRYGVLARSWSLDHIGPLARTAADCALLTHVIAGADPRDSTTSREAVPDYSATLEAGIKGLRIGVPELAAEAGIDIEVRAGLNESIAVLRALGAEPVAVRFPDLTRHFRVADTIIKCEGATIHQHWLRERPQDYSDHVRTRIEAGLYLPATRYLEALSLRGRILAEFLDTVMADIDVLHMPNIPFPVPTRAETDVEGTGERVLAMVTRITGFTRPFNLLGLPALSIPCGFSASGLPVAFQAIGHPFAEATLFRLAYAYQSATYFHCRLPIFSEKS